MNQGEALFGENVYQALEGLSMSPEGRQECARVAAAIPRSRRRPGLSWSHHRAVARRSITPAEREELLDQAERESWGAREIEAAVRARRDDQKLHVKDLKDCDELAESAARDLREQLVACGYPGRHLGVDRDRGSGDLLHDCRWGRHERPRAFRLPAGRGGERSSR